MTKISTLNNKKKPSTCCQKHSPKTARLDNIAQLGTNSQNQDEFKLIQCTHLEDKSKLTKRAKTKYFGHALKLGLANTAKDISSEKMFVSYMRSWACNSVLTIYEDDTIAGKYCKTRWCPNCARIKMAKHIREYYPTLSEWDDAYFVTLTIPNVDEYALRETFGEMADTFAKVKNRIRKQAKRKGLPKFEGVRKLECTHNWKTDMYHPHYHLLMRNKEYAILLRDEWLKEFPLATLRAQDVRQTKKVTQADKNITLELFKYFTKIVTDSKEGRVIRTEPLNVIYTAMYGKRSIQPFGFKLKKEVELSDENEHKLVQARALWIQELGDWANMETGELISGNIPNSNIEKLAHKKVIKR